MSLLESYPNELIEEIIENQRKKLNWYDEIEDHEEVLKSLLLLEYCKIELKVREFEEELKKSSNKSDVPTYNNSVRNK